MPYDSVEAPCADEIEIFQLHRDVLEIYLGLRHAVAYREKRESAFVLP